MRLSQLVVGKDTFLRGASLPTHGLRTWLTGRSGLLLKHLMSLVSLSCLSLWKLAAVNTLFSVSSIPSTQMRDGPDEA